VKIIFFANTDWYLYNFRLAWARFLRDQGLEVVMLSPPGRYGPMLETAGFKWIPLEMDRRSLNPGRELALIRRISTIYAREKPDIVHHFTIKCVVYGSLIARWHGVPNRVNAVTGMGYVFSDSSVLARLLRPVVRKLMKAALDGNGSRLILQNSDDMQAFTAEGLAPEDRMHLIRGSGVDTSRFCPPGIKNRGRQMRVVLASRLLWDKGIGEYVQAARLLRDQALPVEFLLAGTTDRGNPGAVPQRQIDAWQRNGIVTYLGHVDDMPKLFRDVDIAVLPSYYREGVPRSLLEAAACGLPIITADTPGCREIVHHGVTGLIVPPRNAQALADAIRSLYENPAKREAMGEAGRRRVEREFDEQIVFEKTLGVYRQLLTDALS